MHGIKQGSLISAAFLSTIWRDASFRSRCLYSTTQCLSESHPGLYPHSVGGTYARALQATTVQTSLC